MPRQHGKKYREAASAIEEGKFYPPAEAVTLVRQTAVTAFDSSIEAHIRLGIDPRHADQVVRSTVTLPARHGEDPAHRGLRDRREAPRGNRGRRRRGRWRGPRQEGAGG